MAKINAKVFAEYSKFFTGLQTYIIGPDDAMKRLFTQLTGVEAVIVTNPLFVQENLPPPDILVFTGGSDVSPILYGEENTDSVTGINRDVNEMLFYKLYERNPSVLKIGICRGGQFLNVMNGGRMIQHLERGNAHAGEHSVTPYQWSLDGIGDRVNSTHHQGMETGVTSILLLGHKNVAEAAMYSNKSYHFATSLCFQPHPEYEHEGTTSIFIHILGNVIAYMQTRLNLKNVFPRRKVNKLLEDIPEDVEDILEEEEEL